MARDRGVRRLCAAHDVPVDVPDVRNLAWRLCELLKPGLGAEALQSVERGWRGQIGAGGTHGERSELRRSEPLPAPLAAVFARCPAEEWTRPVVLAIDEFQTTPGRAGDPHALALHALTERAYGLRLPLTIVLSGLGDTVETTARLGISRVDNAMIHALGSFTPTETRELIAGWGRHFGVAEGSWQDEMLAIAEANGHWPVHVRNGLAALAKRLVAAGGDVAAVDFAKVRKSSARAQREYYESRMSGKMRDSDFLLAKVMSSLEPGMRRSEVKSLALKHAGTVPGAVGWMIPKGMDVDSYYTHLVHQGALHELPAGAVECPIPNFRSFLIAFGKPPAPKAPAPFGQ